MVKRILFVLITIFFIHFLVGETLWDDINKDIYSKKVRYTTSDTIKVLINENSILDYKGVGKTIKSYQINVKSEEVQGIFELVPNGDITESKNSQEKDNLKFQQQLTCQIVNINNGFLTIAGKKSVNINNKLTTVEIQGDVSYSDINYGRVDSKNIANMILKITTALENENLPLRLEDFEEVEEQIANNNQQQQTNQMTNQQTNQQQQINQQTNQNEIANNQQNQQPQTVRKLKLKDEKKKELLLQYINKIMNVIF